MIKNDLKDMKMPTLAIVLPNYNHSQYLPFALERIFNQTKPADQVIIIDDASTDNSVEIIQSYLHHPNLIFIKNEKNLGGLRSIELANEHIKSDYVYNTAADDMIFPDFVEKMTALAQKYPQAGICTCHPAYMSVDGTIDTHDNWKKHSSGPIYFSPNELIDKIGMGNGWVWVAGHTSIVRRDMLESCGGYLPELRWHADFFLDQVIALRSGVAYTPEPLSALRVVPNSYSNSGVSDPIEQSKVLYTMAHLLNSPTYADVKQAFIKSSLLNCFGEDHKDYMLAVLQPWGERMLAKQTSSSPIIRSFLRNKVHGIKKRLKKLKQFIGLTPALKN